MTIIKTDTSIVLDTKTAYEQWCVYEHHAVLKEGDPPAVILVGACRLRDVYKLVDGKMNTEWTRIFEHGGSLMVRIVGIGDDKNECVREAAMLMREHQPVCNLRGYTLRNVRRSIICLTNGRVYEGQQEAARDLGISQSAISRHLKGEQQHVAGFVFDYEHPNERIDRMKTTRRPLKDDN